MNDLIGMLEDVMNIDYQLVGQSNAADTRFYNTTVNNPGAFAAAGPGSGTGDDIWVYDYATEPPSGKDYSIGSHGYMALIHELGHTIGLSHTALIPARPTTNCTAVLATTCCSAAQALT